MLAGSADSQLTAIALIKDQLITAESPVGQPDHALSGMQKQQN